MPLSVVHLIFERTLVDKGNGEEQQLFKSISRKSERKRERDYSSGGIKV